MNARGGLYYVEDYALHARFSLIIEFIHGDEQGDQSHGICQHTGNRANKQVVDDPEDAGWQSDDPQPALIFHTVGNGGQQLGDDGQQTDDAIVGDQTGGDHKTAECHDHRGSRAILLHKVGI